MGKSSINGPFPMAMLNNQTVIQPQKYLCSERYLEDPILNPIL